MKKHDACIANQYGWVEIDNNTFKCINCVTKKLHLQILNSQFYKNKEGKYWPKVEQNKNYKSNYINNKNIIAYFSTEFIHNILRYPEFTSLQFKEALVFLCYICEYCQKEGYFLRTHLWNITFVKGKPYLIDIRDFEILNNQDWRNIFTGHFRKVLDNHCPISPSKFIENYDYIYNKLIICPNDLQKIKKIINEIIPLNTNDGQWTNYHGERCNFLNTSIQLNDKLYKQIKYFKGGSGDETKSVNLFTLIEKIKPKKVIEVGCNNGLYTFGFSTICPSIGIDYDINAINIANNLNNKFRSNCTFLHCNLLDEMGLKRSFGKNGAYGGIIQRFKSEMLIAPAIIHHLFNQCKSTDKIIEIFNKFAEKYMLIEQIPNTVDEKSLLLSLEKYNWEVIEELPSCPNPRKWLLCEKV